MNALFNSDVLLELLLSFLYLVPVSFFRYIPFMKKFRFSPKVTFVLYFLFFLIINILFALGGMYNTVPNANRTRFIAYVLMIIFSFYLIKEHIGKQLYVICFYGNYSLLFSSAPLVAEHMIFKLDYSNLIIKAVGMIIILIITLPIIYHFSYKQINYIIQCETGIIWNSLWIVGIIQLILNSFLSIPYDSEAIISGRNAIVRATISIGAIILNHTILYVIKQMMKANEENMSLIAEKQQLMIQEYQYRYIQEQIEQSRRFRHDFKHHSAIITSITADNTLSNSDKIKKLTSYCSEYFGSVPEAEERHFCDNYPLNLIINYYYDKANQIKCDFNAKINLPSKVAIPDTELCIIVGNLLLNATEAVVNAPINLQKITINISKKENNLLILVENGFDGQLNQSNDVFHSTKHDGDGIGIISIRNIATKYNGHCYFEHHDKVFSAKIHLFLEY